MSSPSSHSGKCGPTKKQARPLGAFGITGGNPSTLTPKQVHEFFALWTAESAQPFCIVNNRFLQKLLHPDAHRHMPHRDTISKNIRRIYEATQADITAMLESSNGLDFLGIVIFRHLFTLDKSATVERFVLECLSYTDAHSGETLAKVLHSVMRKFKIEDCVWGIVCDNASNNGTMMEALAKYDLKQLKGPQS
ncbi:hypothetical protein BDV93DRAFT_444019 [Ceratobasidium sp. AG-I]|nr:hypothetical protein BDV93DRAFT_444019 [Ceratobasidium sp. AG-I]